MTGGGWGGKNQPQRAGDHRQSPEMQRKSEQGRDREGRREEQGGAVLPRETGQPQATDAQPGSEEWGQWEGRRTTGRQLGDHRQRESGGVLCRWKGWRLNYGCPP